MDKLFIERKAILTLDNAAKIEAVITMPSPRKAMFHEEIQKKFVEDFNKAQPYAVHKLVKVHIMRN